MSLLAAESVGTAAEADAPVQPLSRTVVALRADPSGTAVAVGNQAGLTWRKLRDQGPVNVEGIQVAAGPVESSFILRGAEREAVVEADDFSGWAARLPRGDEATLRVDRTRGLLDLATSARNPQPVTVRFADGGRAEIKALASTRFDLLSDGAYTFSGSGDIYAIDNAGLATTLSADRPPMTGGPLVEARAPDGTAKRARLTPLTEIAVAGELGAELTLKAGNQTVRLQPGERKNLQLPNGSAFEVKHNSGTQTLDWRVGKGYCRFQIEGMNCWHPIGLTDSAAAIQWNVPSKMADVRNLSTERDVLVDLAVRYFAQVGPKSIFQYSEVGDCTTFTVSATGSRVVLFNAETGREYPLDLNNFAVNAGVPEQDGSRPVQMADKPRKTILLSGESTAQFQVQGALGSAVVVPNSQKTLGAVAGGDALQINCDQGGRLTLHATAGDYMILVPTSGGNVALGLNQGDAISLNGNTSGGQLTFQTPSGNITPVFLAAGGQGLSFGPNSQATIKTGGTDNGLTIANVVGSVAPVAPSGNLAAAVAPSPPTAPAPTPPPQNAPIQIDSSRIQQLPVSPDK